jgi:hypothetical protein
MPCRWPYRNLPVTVPCPIRDLPCPLRDRTVPCPWLYRALSVTYRALSMTVLCPFRDRNVPSPWPYRVLSVTYRALSVTAARGHCCYSTVKNTWQPADRNVTIHIRKVITVNDTKRRGVEEKPHILYTSVLNKKEWPVSRSVRFTLGENIGGKFWIPWNLSWKLYYCAIYYYTLIYQYIFI